MNESILTWNITNWVTVILMAAGGFVVFALAAQLFHKSVGAKQQQAA